MPRTDCPLWWSPSLPAQLCRKTDPTSTGVTPTPGILAAECYTGISYVSAIHLRDDDRFSVPGVGGEPGHAGEEGARQKNGWKIHEIGSEVQSHQQKSRRQNPCPDDYVAQSTDGADC